MKLPRVLFISGKGGSGKSSVAASLARALSATRRVLLIDLDGRGTAAKLSGARAEDAQGALRAKSLSPRAELERFIERIAPLRAVAQRMLASRTFGFVTAALPGLEAFLVIERLRLLEEESDARGVIVVDGPATGGALELLAVAKTVARLAVRGTLRTLALRQEEFLTDPARFGVWLTVIPERLAISETLSARASLAAADIRCDTVVLNRARKRGFSSIELKQLSGAAQHQAWAARLEAARQASAAAARAMRRSGVRTIALLEFFSPDFGSAEIEILAKTFRDLGKDGCGDPA